MLELAGATEVSLARERPDGSGARGALRDCEPVPGGTYSAGAGAFVLTIAPAERGEGRAKVSGLGNEDAGCNIAYSIRGVRFRLWRLLLPTSFSNEPDRLRNRLAHLLLGTADAERDAAERNPLGTPIDGYGLLDKLRATCLTEEQVPLAVLTWTAADGIRFVDLWSVRRRIEAPGANRRFATLIDDRRRAEAEATFLQFQTQVTEIVLGSGGLEQLAAAERFAFLPPVGIVPLAGDAAAGFDADHFLGDQGSDELATLDGAQLRSLLLDSFAHAPIAVAARGERIQRYRLWDATERALDVLVFARGTLPYRGRARYGHARFGRSRFAPTVI